MTMRATAPSATDVKARLIGVACLLAAAGVAWYGGLRPLQMAQQGAPSVEYTMKAFLFAPMAALGGAALLLGGAPVMRSFSGPPKGRVQVMATIALVGAAFIIGGLAYWWVGERLRALGYNVS